MPFVVRRACQTTTEWQCISQDDTAEGKSSAPSVGCSCPGHTSSCPQTRLIMSSAPWSCPGHTSSCPQTRLIMSSAPCSCPGHTSSCPQTRLIMSPAPWSYPGHTSSCPQHFHLVLCAEKKNGLLTKGEALNKEFFFFFFFFLNLERGERCRHLPWRWTWCPQHPTPCP